ncbi:hypothetical protein [Halobacteriovorax sp. JY17]|uniref:hypothetical protein n=1 Tax=Halobacteriovorax sp. JY17 TaxID=2014617 RepID=UPI000C5D80F6|nr:hypothetical protein [Halobacteriovorax sp. JY17]PIK15913.1 MAG: hypothetical protein CES88_04080 [Halobacteriovorax sp. JY17]
MKTQKTQMRNKKGLLRQASATISICALIYSPLSFSAQEPTWVDQGVKIMDSALQTMQQSMQQTMMNNQMAAQMSALQPQVIPSKFFPHCKISQARSAFPEDVCKATITDPNALNQAMQYKNLARTYSSMYEQLLSPAQNSSFPVGLQCLEDAKKGMVTSLQDRLNSLEALKGKIEKESQFFRDENKKLLTDMEDSHQELFGGGSGDVDAKTRDFSTYFSPACQNIIGQDKLASAAKAGLNGIKVGLSGANKSAANFVTNKSQIESDVNSQIQKIKNQIESQGIDQWRKDVSAGEQSINGADLARMGVAKPMIGVISTEISRMNNKVSNIKSELAKIVPGYDIPTMDSNFRVDFANFTKDADNYFKKKYINECVTMADKGVAISPDQILKSLRVGGNGDRSVALNNYKTALQNILDSDAFIEDKLAQIQALDNRYSNSDISIQYKNSGAQTITTTPYGLFRETVSQCEQRYTQDDTFSAGQSGQVSQAKQVSRAKKYLNDLKELESTFAATIGNQIYESVINCSGRTEKTNTCSAEGIFDQGSDAFCVKHATTCSGRVQSCFSEANTLVEAKKAKIKSYQATYNKNVTALVARQEAYLAQVKAQVLADADYLKKYFPGANFNFPEGLFIKMPENSESEFGVDLLGGGSLDFLANLPDQIAKLKETLKEQSGEITGVVNDYIAAQKGAMDTQKGKWEALASNCSNAENGYRDFVNAQNAQQQQTQQEKMGEVGEFCQKYEQLGNLNPAAGCDESDYSAKSLYETVGGVANHISSEAEYGIAEYRKLCARANNERERGTEDDDDEDRPKRISQLAEACNENNNDTEEVIEDLSKKAISSLPSEFANQKSKIEKFLQSNDDDSLSSAVKKSNYFKKVLAPLAKITSKDDFESQEEFKTSIRQAIQGKTISDDKVAEYAKIARDNQTNCDGLEGEEGTKCKNVFTLTDDRALLSSIAEKGLIGNLGLSGKLNKDDLKVTGGATGSVKEKLEDILDKVTDSKKNFCNAHENEAILAAVKDCKSDDKSSCFNKKLDYHRQAMQDSTKSADRAIASITDNSLDAEWKKIGEVTANSQCQAADASQRSAEGLFQQMQNIGGADFSGQLGFGK